MLMGSNADNTSKCHEAAMESYGLVWINYKVCTVFLRTFVLFITHSPSYNSHIFSLRRTIVLIIRPREYIHCCQPNTQPPAALFHITNGKT